MKARPIIQRHHLIYGSDQGTKNREVVRYVRRGVHFAITTLRRYSFLTDEEINTIHIEAELKRQFREDDKDIGDGKGSKKSV